MVVWYWQNSHKSSIIRTALLQKNLNTKKVYTHGSSEMSLYKQKIWN